MTEEEKAQRLQSGRGKILKGVDTQRFLEKLDDSIQRAVRALFELDVGIGRWRLRVRIRS